MSSNRVFSQLKSGNKVINRSASTKTSAGNRANSSPAQYCMNSVRQSDYENFLCTLLLPKNARTCAFAVRAFNVEVSLIQGHVSNPSIGQMRLKFWDDTLKQIYSNDETSTIPAHPIAKELYKEHNLTKRYFQRLLNSRCDRLVTSSYLTMDDITKYCEESVSSVYYLLLEGNGVRNVHADHAASHLGKAQGIANMLRSLPHMAQERVVYLPQEVLMKHGVSQESILRKKENKGVQDVIFDVASTANYHLEKARELTSSVPSDAKILLLPAAAVGQYLERLRRTDFKVFHPTLQARNGALPLTLFWNKLRSKY